MSTLLIVIGLVTLIALSHVSVERGIGLVALCAVLLLLLQSNFTFGTWSSLAIGFMGASEGVLIWQLPTLRTVTISGTPLVNVWRPEATTFAVFLGAVTWVLCTAALAAWQMQESERQKRARENRGARESPFWEFLHYWWVLTIPYALPAIIAGLYLFT